MTLTEYAIIELIPFVIGDYEEEYNWNNDYNNDGSDMDHQSESYWQELGIF